MMKRAKNLSQLVILLMLAIMLAFAAVGCDNDTGGGCDNPTPIPTPAPTSTPVPTPAPTPLPTPSPNATCAVQYMVQDQWSTGFAADIKVTNLTNAAIKGYTLTWSFSSGQQITKGWNATVTQSGANVSASNPAGNWNGTIAANGGTVRFGFQATQSGVKPAPTQFALNGQTCSMVGPTPPPPTPTPTPTPGPTPPQPPPPAQNGTDGYATRYWDCCKPHCGWIANVPAGVNPVGTCNFDNLPNGVSDMIKSSCDGGDGFTCWNMAPYAVSDKLAYGYAAVSATGDICGKCYQLDFKGTSFNASDDPGSKALAGKTMIVQATNIGYDVSNGQIDLLVPGGGVGAFDACTEQWGATSDQMGERYGGFLLACKHELGWNASHDAYKSCVMQRCEDLFSQPGMTDLLDGCRWFVDWFEAADNPALVFKEVPCPDALNNVSGMLP